MYYCFVSTSTKVKNLLFVFYYRHTGTKFRPGAYFRCEKSINSQFKKKLILISKRQQHIIQRTHVSSYIIGILFQGYTQHNQKYIYLAKYTIKTNVREYELVGVHKICQEISNVYVRRRTACFFFFYRIHTHTHTKICVCVCVRLSSIL